VFEAAISVSSLCVYPVKALRGLRHRDVAVEPWGLQDDRRWMVVKPDGALLTQRELPAMATLDAAPGAASLRLSRDGAPPLSVPIPEAASAERRVVRVWKDHVPALDAGPAAAAWLGEALGTECGLVYLDDVDARPVEPAFSQPGDRTAFSDGYPLLLTTTGSLAALNAALPAGIPMDRFRPNLVVDGPPAWAEDGWRRLRIGEVVFRVASPCARCVVTTTDQRSGLRPDKTEPLRTLSRLRRTREGVMFGQNLIPDGSGRIAVGDRVEILETGPSNVQLVTDAS
jgi:uncharacterized protein YcbX